MNAVILAGGKGTRLRPLTLNTPKPIVPILSRPFLSLQLDLLRKTGIDNVVLSLSYQPRRIEEMFGDGGEHGIRIHYTMEPEPLGTAGAVKNAEGFLGSRTIVFNGDVLSDLDLTAVLDFHERAGAQATIVLTPVPDPSAYGLVETEADGRVRRFLEKPSGDEITCDTINAGVYVLEPELLKYIPPATNYSFERGFFPHLLSDRVPFFAYVHRGYWIDIGTPEKYLKVHRDILARALPFQGFHPDAGGTYVDPEATVEGGARLIGPAYVGAGSVVKAHAVIEPYAVVGANCRIEEGASVGDSVLWSGTRIGEEARVRGALIGRSAHVGHHVVIDRGVVLGDKSVVTDYSRVAPAEPN
jgi:NDP-sugar pyrophosphorylase family protein